MANKLLNREGILAAKDRVVQDVEVKEWGGSVRLRTLTLAEQEELERTAAALHKDSVLSKDGRRLVLLLSWCLIGEDGKPLFTVADVETLATKDAKVVLRLATHAGRLNSISERDLEALAKN